MSIFNIFISFVVTWISFQNQHFNPPQMPWYKKRHYLFSCSLNNFVLRLFGMHVRNACEYLVILGIYSGNTQIITIITNGIIKSDRILSDGLSNIYYVYVQVSCHYKEIYSKVWRFFRWGKLTWFTQLCGWWRFIGWNYFEFSWDVYLCHLLLQNWLISYFILIHPLEPPKQKDDCMLTIALK